MIQYRNRSLFSIVFILGCFLSPTKGYAVGQEDYALLPYVFGSSPTIDVSPVDTSPYRAIGLIYNRVNQAYGTGFLISPCHALTAKHVAEYSDGRVTAQGQVEMYLGTGTIGPEASSPTAHFKYKAIARPIAWGTYPSPDPFLNSESEFSQKTTQDWVLLQLQPCLGAPQYGLGFLKLKSLSTFSLLASPTPVAVEMAGYSGKALKGIAVDKNCQLFGPVNDKIWQSNCQMRPGFSGGPIMVVNPSTGERQAVAIVSSGLQAVLKREHSDQDYIQFPLTYPLYYERLGSVVPGEVLFRDRSILLSGPEPKSSPFLSGTKKIIWQHWDAALSSAIQGAPNLAPLRIRRGIMREHIIGNLDGAIADYRKAYKLDPAFPPARWHLARALNARAKRNDHSLALKLLDGLAIEYPETMHILKEQISTLAALQRCHAAWEAFNHFTSVTPEGVWLLMRHEIEKYDCR